jgi:hypothetical protein
MESSSGSDGEINTMSLIRFCRQQKEEQIAFDVITVLMPQSVPD